MLERLRVLSPFPYYINHLVVACVISAAAVGLTWQIEGVLAGAAFYAAREVWQWRRHPKRWFDWKGLLWPVVPLVAVYFLVTLAG